MRTVLLALALGPSFASSQTWEKVLAEGVVLRSEVRFAPARVITALRIRPSVAGVRLAPGLSGGKVFDSAEEDGRSILTKTVQASGALIGVNADYFPWTGDPLGLMVINRELVSRPYPGRSVLAWGAQNATVARCLWKASLKAPGGDVDLATINEECGEKGTVLVTPSCGQAVAKGDATIIVFETDDRLPPTGKLRAKVMTVVTGIRSLPIRTGQLAIVYAGSVPAPLAALKKGDEVTVTSTVSGVEWPKYEHAIGGGPVIVAEGEPLQAWDAEGFRPEFATNRHPRTAIGATAEGDIWIVVVDGRQAMSSGVTLDELADVMAGLGCRDAINLDGGGSSEIAFADAALNRPSEGAERPLANALLVFAEPQASASDFVIAGSQTINVGQGADLRVVDRAGKAVPNAQVVWSATGSAWVDQGGRVRGLAAGSAIIRAWVGGKSVSRTFTVLAPVPSGGG